MISDFLFVPDNLSMFNFLSMTFSNLVQTVLSLILDPRTRALILAHKGKACDAHVSSSVSADEKMLRWRSQYGQ